MSKLLYTLYLNTCFVFAFIKRYKTYCRIWIWHILKARRPHFLMEMLRNITLVLYVTYIIKVTIIVFFVVWSALFYILFNNNVLNIKLQLCYGSYTYTHNYTTHTHNILFWKVFPYLELPPPPILYHKFPVNRKVIFWSQYLVFNGSAAGQELC